MKELEDHEWPTVLGEHVWSPWYAKTGLPGRPTQYRTCVHPKCGASETREAPMA